MGLRQIKQKVLLQNEYNCTRLKFAHQKTLHTTLAWLA